jgi:hypothetical protein
MVLSYPYGFPEDFLTPVAAAESRAERIFRSVEAGADGDVRLLRVGAREYVNAVCSSSLIKPVLP